MKGEGCLPWELFVARRWEVPPETGLTFPQAVLLARLQMRPGDLAFRLGKDPSLGGFFGVVEGPMSLLESIEALKPFIRDKEVYRELLPKEEGRGASWRFYLFSPSLLAGEGFLFSGLVRPHLSSPRMGNKIVRLDGRMEGA